MAQGVTKRIVWHPCPRCGYMTRHALRSRRFGDKTWDCTNDDARCGWIGLMPEGERPERRDWAARATQAATERKGD